MLARKMHDLNLVKLKCENLIKLLRFCLSWQKMDHGAVTKKILPSWDEFTQFLLLRVA